MSCGSPLAAPEPVRELRKVVTVVFADVTGSTGLGERLDPESLRSIMGRWFEAMRIVLERHGGTVEKFIGDAVVAVFGVPVLHEDDGLRAVRSAHEMTVALASLNAALRAERGLEIAMRIGVNTGEVVVGLDRAGGSRATGDAVNVAARLQQSAEPGEVLLGETTWRLVRDAVEVREPRAISVKGREQPVDARSLVAVRHVQESISRRVGGPMVGRERELGTLLSAFERVVDDETCVLVTVLGTPGVGKSRLVHEFLASVRSRARVLRGRCLPYGEGITWLPVADLLRSAVGAAEDDDGDTVRAALVRLLEEAPDADALLERLRQPLGIPGDPVPRDELVWAVRRFIERLATTRPVVVVLDDLQWAEETLLDLVEHLADWITSVPVLLLVMARPELLDARSGWGGGKPNATTFRLEPLPAADTERLVDELLAGAALPADARARVAAAADGNPLYVEQVIEVLLDDGALRRGDDGALAVGDLGAITVPPTMQALLAARLDRLDDAERRTIERASVVGKEFRRMEVLELTPETGRDGVPTQLRSLVRKELIRPDRDRQLDVDETYRFRHLLIRDAAYESLPKAERAELHERFADWLEATGAGRLAELDEIVGYHLDQARTYRLDLAPDDARTRALALRAGRRLAAAGSRAIERGEAVTAIRLLQRADGLLAGDPAAHFEALLDLGDAAWALNDANTYVAASRSLEEIAPGLGEVQALRATLNRWLSLAFSDPTFVLSDHAADVGAALQVFEAAGSVDGLLDVDNFQLAIALNLARWRDVEMWAERGIVHARAAGRQRNVQRFSTDLTNAYVWGPQPVSAALARIDLLLAEGVSRIELGWHLNARATLLAYAGDADGSDREHARVVQNAEELGMPSLVGHFRLSVSRRFLGDFEGSLAAAVLTSERLATVGETGTRSTVVCFAGQACLELGREDEAFAFAEQGRQLGAEDDVTTQVLWRVIEAIVLARRGEHAAADALSLEALERNRDSDGTTTPDAWIARAECLALAGRHAEAEAAARAGYDYWAAKECVNGMRWAERWMAPSSATAPA